MPGKLTGIVRAQCSLAGTARGEDAEVELQLCAQRALGWQQSM